jgi:hypothetical protein
MRSVVSAKGDLFVSPSGGFAAKQHVGNRIVDAKSRTFQRRRPAVRQSALKEKTDEPTTASQNSRFDAIGTGS